MVAEKQCSECKETKPASEFNIRNASKDGLQGRCRQCQLECLQEYAQTEAGKQVHRKSNARYYQTEAGKESRRRGNARYYQSEAGKIAARNQSKRYREKYPERIKAGHAVSTEVAAGRMPHISTQDCERCGDQADHYHHPDYDYPLDVEALCNQCHVDEHNKEMSNGHV